MMFKKYVRAVGMLLFLGILSCGDGKKGNTVKQAADVQPPNLIKTLILDGQNNHYVWPKTTMMMKDYLEQTGLFQVEVRRMDSIWLGIKYKEKRPEGYTQFITDYPVGQGNQAISHDPIKTSDFSIDFEAYDLIVSNLGFEAAPWPVGTRAHFETYMRNGGSLVVVHAANNAWGDWPEYNRMIGLGAWGGRDETAGPYVYYNDQGEVVRDSSAGVCGSHGPEYEYELTTREPDHPIMKGLPNVWLHTQDELYERMRGPFENATILATAYADVEKNAPPWDPNVKGLGQHVPMLMTVNYGKGRIFHTTLGHFDYSMECVGFMTTLQRGAEWAATGKVTQAVPKDFPGPGKTSSRAWGN
ncbi:ThuA domain-containing protein [Maribacter sp. 2307ULW6-5]|uniref:ThuA domain-containing protein n=1 Tax=Maribacter sp. 2307ULW6-5 TaxID=3386275 RepID=UPI0039BC42BB